MKATITGSANAGGRSIFAGELEEVTCQSGQSVYEAGARRLPAIRSCVPCPRIVFLFIDRVPVSYRAFTILFTDAAAQVDQEENRSQNMHQVRIMSIVRNGCNAVLVNN